MDKSFDTFWELFKQLSPDLQRAFYLLIDNIEFLDELVAADDTPSERLEQLLDEAKERNDTFLQVLIKYELVTKYGLT